MLLVDERDDGVDRMTGKQVRFELNTDCLRLSPRRRDHGCEPMVRFGLFLLHFVDARGKPRQLFHRDHVKRRTIPLCHLDRARKRLQGPLGSRRSPPRSYGTSYASPCVTTALSGLVDATGLRLENRFEPTFNDDCRTTALPITAINRIVYWRSSMM